MRQPVNITRLADMCQKDCVFVDKSEENRLARHASVTVGGDNGIHAVYGSRNISGWAAIADQGEREMNTKTGLRSGYPGGSYQESCEIIGYNPNSRILQANCERFDGNLDYSSVQVPEVY